MSDNQDNDFELGDGGSKAGSGSEDRREQPREERRSSDRDTRSGDREERRRDDRRRDDEDDSKRGFTIADMGRAFNVRPTSGGLGDVALQRLIQAFDANKTFDKPNVPEAIRRDRFKILPLDGALARSSLSSVLVVLPTTIGSSNYTLVYVLTIENASGVQTRQSTDRGESYDALVLPEDQLGTKAYREAIEDQVRGLLQNSKIQVVGKQVLLASVVGKLGDVDSKTPSPIVDRIFDNVLDALCGVRENIVDRISGKRNSQIRLNPNMIGKGARLETSWDNSGKPGEDSSGLQIRSDVTATLYYSEASRDDDERYDRTPMGEIRAGLDLVLVDSSGGEDRGRRRGRGRGRNSRDQLEPFWQGVMNVNSIAPAGNFPFSLELAQLLLAQIAVQSNDNRSANLLRPRAAIAAPGGGTMAPTSHIENLMLLHPDKDLAKVYDDVSQNMTDDELLDYLDITVLPDLAFGLTIPSSGEKSWVLSIFERIATSKDRDEVKALVNVLFDSADVLTDGHFRREWKKLVGSDSDRVPVESLGTRVLIGTWVDDKGNTRDLREWNVQSMLTSYGEKNADRAADFQYTFEDTYHGLGYNLAERYRMQQQVVPGIRVVDTAEMIAFDPDYVEALSISLDLANMSSYQTSSDGLNARRHAGNSRYSSLSTSDVGVVRRRGSDRDSRDRSDRRGGSGLFGGRDY